MPYPWFIGRVFQGRASYTVWNCCFFRVWDSGVGDKFSVWMNHHHTYVILDIAIKWIHKFSNYIYIYYCSQIHTRNCKINKSCVFWFIQSPESTSHLPTSIRTDECCSTPERCLRCLDSTRGGTRKLGIANDTKTAAKVKRSHGPLDRNAIDPSKTFFGQTAVLPSFLRS